MAETVKIDVERTSVEKTGRRGDRPWTLFTVHCTQQDGTAFDRPVRTFDQLPTGLVEVEIEAYSKDGAHAWTVKLPKQRKAGTSNADAELVARVERLERQMKALLGDADIEIKTGVQA